MWLHQRVNRAALPLMSLGKQMLRDIRSCAYLWSNLFITNLRAGESFVTNVKKDCSNGVDCANEPSKARRATALDQRELPLWLKKKFEPRQP